MVLDWGLNLGPPTLEASTIPLGYWGGGFDTDFVTVFWQFQGGLIEHGLLFGNQEW